MAGFEVIQHPKEGFKGRLIAVSAIKAGLKAIFSDDLLHFALFNGVFALTHEADTGDQTLVPVNQAFKLRKTASATFNSRKVTEAVLVPVANGGNITELSLMMASDKKPEGILVKTSDGNVITVVVKDFAVGGKAPVKDFGYDTKKLGDGYIVTDLR